MHAIEIPLQKSSLKRQKSAQNAPQNRVVFVGWKKLDFCFHFRPQNDTENDQNVAQDLHRGKPLFFSFLNFENAAHSRAI